MTKEAQRTELHKTNWRIANDLRGAVDGYDHFVNAAFNGRLRVLVGEVMGVRARAHVDVALRRVGGHGQEIRIQIRFALKIHQHVDQVLVQRIRHHLERFQVEHSGGPCKGPQPRGAFRTTQIAACGGFYPDFRWIAPMNGLAQQTRPLK